MRLAFTTESGARYLVRSAPDDTLEAQRIIGPYSHGILYDVWPDGEWMPLTYISPVVVGQPVTMHYGDHRARYTTHVVSVLDFEEGGL